MRSPLSAVLALTVAVALAACGSTKEPAASPPSGGWFSPGLGLVFKMQDLLGFAPPGTPPHMPLAVYSDGRVILARDTAEETALPNPELRQLTQAGVQRVLQAAIDAGLTTTTDYGDPAAFDVGATRFTVVNQGRLHSVRVEGADYPAMMQGEPFAQARDRLQAFRKQLTNLDSWLGSELSPAMPYGYQAMAVTVQSMGAVELPEGFPAPKDWPFEDLVGTRCVVYTGDKLTQAAKLASEASAFSAWKSNNELYFLAFRPLLPDEMNCKSLPSQ